MKTKELMGLELNIAVGLARKAPIKKHPSKKFLYTGNLDLGLYREYCPSEAWEQGGNIIEIQNICITKMPKGDSWRAYKLVSGKEEYQTEGPTPLIAAMRCCVLSVLGEEITLPTLL